MFDAAAPAPTHIGVDKLFGNSMSHLYKSYLIFYISGKCFKTIILIKKGTLPLLSTVYIQLNVRQVSWIEYVIVLTLPSSIC